MSRKETLIRQLNLQAHPEGGYFAETYRSDGEIPPKKQSSGEYPGGRPFSTAIYYLLGEDDVSHFHRLQSDEIWHHYEGSPATIHIIEPDGNYKALQLGNKLENGERFQHTVPAGNWFAVSVNDRNGFFLAGCTVAPGFDFEDFEMADRNRMPEMFPQHETLIRKFCK